MNRHLRRMLILPAVLIGSVGSVGAEIVDEERERVIVRENRPALADRRDSLADTSLVTLDEHRQPQTSIGRVIDEVVGVRVRSAGGSGRREIVQLRGGSGQQLAVYLDDIRLSSGRGGATDLSQLPVLGIKQVQITRGAASAAYGSHAQTGLVRLITEPLNTPKFGATLRLSSLGLHQIDGMAGGSEGSMEGFVGIRMSDSVGHFPYIDGNGQARRRHNNDHQRWGILSKGRLKLDNGQWVTVLLDGMIDNRGEPGSSQFPNKHARSDDNRMSGALGWRATNLLDGQVQTAVTAEGTIRQYELRDPGSLYQPGQQNFSMDDQQVGLTTEVTWEGSLRHRPQLLVEGRYENAKTQSSVTTRGGRSEQRTSGAATMSWSVNPVNSLTIQPVVRLDARTGRTAMWVPKLGTRWSVNSVVKLQANVGQIFRDPSFDELYFVGVGLSGDPTLQPEDGIGFDTSMTIKSPLDMPFTLQITWFRQRYDRIILFVPIDAYRIQASDRFSAQNDGLETQLSIGRSTWLTLAHTFQRPRFLGQNSMPLPLRPSHIGHLRLTAPWGAIQPTLRWSAQSSMTADRFGERRLPGYSTIDLGVGIAPPGPMRILIEMRNLMDIRNRFDAVHQPLPGRVMFVELRWRT